MPVAALVYAKRRPVWVPSRAVRCSVAVPCCQKLPSDLNLQNAQATVYVDAPSLDIYELGGDLTLYDEAAEGGATVDALSLENALWANSVLASGTAVAGGGQRAALPS